VRLVLKHLVAAAFGLGLTACASSSNSSAQRTSAVENPSGSCEASGDGSRAGYHSAAGTTWLPDCRNTLQREYWRVFAQARDSAYVIPRPDGARELGRACSDPAHELNSVVVKYSLCGAASSPAEVERVNNMQPVDALAITHFMHGMLRFISTGSGVSPYPLPTDILDACALHPDGASAELRFICDRERDRLSSGQEIGFDYSGPGAIELAELLNELYGIR
jgi:hypothetical protein